MRIVRRILGAIIAVAALLWVGDFIPLRIPIPPGRQQYGSVTTRTELTATQKDKRVEFYFLPPEDTDCVHSLFPHFGDYPCWWLVRHPTIVKSE